MLKLAETCKRIHNGITKYYSVITVQLVEIKLVNMSISWNANIKLMIIKIGKKYSIND